MKGNVKWFKHHTGYGFIETEDEEEFFVHYTNIIDETSSYKRLFKGDIVEFEIMNSEKGPQAVEVRIIERAPKERPVKPDWYKRRSF